MRLLELRAWRCWPSARTAGFSGNSRFGKHDLWTAVEGQGSIFLTGVATAEHPGVKRGETPNTCVGAKLARDDR